MRLHPRAGAPRQAAAAVEFAVVLIILMPLLVGVWEVGRLVNAYQVVMNATREGGRQAATGIYSTPQIKQFVLTYLQNNGFSRIKNVASDTADLNTGGKVLVGVTVYDTSGTVVTNGDPKADAKQMYRIEVTVTVLYKDIEYSPTAFFLQPSQTVTATVNWNCMKDSGLTVNDTIPLY